MKQLTWQREGEVLVARWSLWGRVRRAGGLMLKVVPFAFLALVIFFGPDVLLGDITEREPVRGLFWLSLAGMALAAGILAGMFRLLRRVEWIFDGEERRVVAAVRTLMGTPVYGEAELREVAALLIVSGGKWGKSGLRMRLKSGEEEELFVGSGLGKELEELAAEIKDFMGARRYEVKVLRPGAGEEARLES